MTHSSPHLAIIGLGYVGLPLAIEFGKHYPTIGFDIHHERVNELRAGRDTTREVEAHEFKTAEQLSFTDQLDSIADANIYIVTVPTPVNQHNHPDLRPLQSASRSLGSVLNAGDIVIYESTVYPGATEEVCIPELEDASGLTYNQDFYVGYSPERINPGDKVNRLPNIIKITSGSTPEIAERIDALYRTIITAGTHKAPSIKVAEAAKVIENTQRDLNIALINELAIIFDKLKIDTLDVLEAAGTKWNFLPFRPGMVGGHCIGVDPYYLTHKAQSVGYYPDVILAGRRINNGMAAHVASAVTRLMLEKRIQVVDANVLVMGLTFKENCPDLRNSKVFDLTQQLSALNMQVDCYDPWVDPSELSEEHNFTLITELGTQRYDAVILAVGHDQFRELQAADLERITKPESVVYDLKYVLNKDWCDGRL